MGEALGQFIGGLHARSFGDTTLAARFDNLDVQRTRLAVQYTPIAAWAKAAGLPEADVIGANAVALGETLLKPGYCLIMGDLWPPSILADPSGLRLIDWEFCHFGRPAQDVAHLIAHLWMAAHRATTTAAEVRAQATSHAFLLAYRETLGVRRPLLLTRHMLRECALHFGAEIFARTVGPFQAGGRYEGLTLDDVMLREALYVAAEHLRTPDAPETFALLHV